MATVLTIELPTGYRKTTGGPVFDNIRTGKPGLWVITTVPFAYWEFTVSYKRSQIPANFDEIYRFFLVTGAAYCFLVDDGFDNTATSQGGAGIVKLYGTDYRLFRRYSFGGQNYDHPVTRPKNDVVLAGGAAGGTLDPNTGIVTGISGTGTWTGGYWRPMVMLENKLSFDRNPGMAVDGINVPLQEQLEIAL